MWAPAWTRWRTPWRRPVACRGEQGGEGEGRDPVWIDLAMGQNPVPSSEHPNPHENRLKWVVHLFQNGTIGFEPWPFAALFFLFS